MKICTNCMLWNSWLDIWELHDAVLLIINVHMSTEICCCNFQNFFCQFHTVIFEKWPLFLTYCSIIVFRLFAPSAMSVFKWMAGRKKLSFFQKACIENIWLLAWQDFIQIRFSKKRVWFFFQKKYHIWPFLPYQIDQMLL